VADSQAFREHAD